MVAPDQEAEHGDREAGKADEGIAENPLAGEAGDDLADHAHAGQNHDVHGRVRVEPEQVLKQDRVAAQLGIENADAQKPLHAATSTSEIASTGVPSTMIMLVA